MRKPQSYSSLSKAELIVLEEISGSEAEVLDVAEIAKNCQLSEVETAVALQLLKHKNAIPDQRGRGQDA